MEMIPTPFFQINIVGVKRLGNLETCTVEDLDVALNGCVRSTFIVCKEAIPELIKTKGAIVNMSSVCEYRCNCSQFFSTVTVILIGVTFFTFSTIMVFHTAQPRQLSIT